MSDLQVLTEKAHCNGADIFGCLPKEDLILGSVNAHQDLHFSTFYLRASLSSATLPHYPGYSFILSVYENGVERYFIAAREAEQTSKWLINRCASEPYWLSEKLSAIESRSRQLAQAFPQTTTAESLRHTSTDDLVATYLQHNSLHRALYQYARIPEALDRGSPFFSDYLREYLRQIGVADSDLLGVFQALTTPRIPSIIAQEERAFNAIVATARVSCSEFLKSHTIQMFLPSPIREALRLHREEWGWLSYHGFRNRALPTEGDYARRLCEKLTTDQPDLDASRSYDILSATPAFAPEGVDDQHLELFRLYSEIGRIKLFRRFWQLRNFYFLDLLLAEFAHRLGATEWEIRCCLPEEVLTALNRGALDPSIKKRVHRCAILYFPDGEHILDGDDVVDLLDSVSMVKEARREQATRQGTSACIGFARGTARIVGQRSFQQTAFQTGEIVICEAADPDLLPIIRQAAAMVTAQGGVTSHASVLCREIGIPTIIGVDDLLSFVKDGDEIEVDATHGFVRLAVGKCNQSGPALMVPTRLWDRPECVGNKAANLRLAIKKGFKVPPFTLLAFETIAKMMEKNAETLRRELVDLSMSLQPNLLGPELFLLRSSGHDEDAAGSLRAGSYVSVRFSLTPDPLPIVREFVEKNRRLGYNGAVILQRFLPASICGASVDGDPRADAEHKLIVEFVRGSLNRATSGRGALERLVYDYRSGELVATVNRGTTQAAFDDIPTNDLIEWLYTVGRAFGRPAYTEWGFLEGEHWLYQIRGGAAFQFGRN
jgi:phosphohistidine swiveling domain-containing protein